MGQFDAQRIDILWDDHQRWGIRLNCSRMDLNHRFPGCHPGVLTTGPRDRMSGRGERRTHKITRLSGTDRRLVAPLCLFAYPAASGRPGGRTRRSELMRLRWTLVRLRQLKVTKGRVELPCLAARRSERRVYPSSPLGQRYRVTRAGIEPALPA